MAPIDVFQVLCPETSGGRCRRGPTGHPGAKPVIRKTLLSALGAGTLLLGALAAGAPRGRRPLGPARQARVRRLDPGHRRELPVEGAGQRQGHGAEHRHPEPRRQDPGPAQGRLQADRHQLRRQDRRDRRRLRLPEPRARPRDVPLLLRAPRLHHGQRLPDASWTRTAAPACRASTPAGRASRPSTSTPSRRSAPTARSSSSRPRAPRIADLGTAVNTAAKQAGVVADLEQLRRRRPVRRDVRHLLQPPGHRGDRVHG